MKGVVLAGCPRAVLVDVSNEVPRFDVSAGAFANLVTNLRPPVRRLRVHNHDITATAKTYSEARPGEPFVYVGSMGYLEVGVRESRADRLLGARPGMKVETI